MADATLSPDKPPNSNPEQPVSENSTLQPDPSQQLPSLSTPPPANPSSDPNLPPPPLAPPSIQPYATSVQIPAVPPSAPSFRPAALPVPLPVPPQFSPIPNANFQTQSSVVQPPGVAPVPGSTGLVYAQPPNPTMRPYMQMPNGYMPMPPPGIPRYPGVYPMVRPIYPPRPMGIVGINPALARPPVPGVRGPIIPPVIRPGGILSVTPAEKPQTTVYVGKIASTVDNDFILSVLQLCGIVKSWKRPQDPTSGTLKGYGFCEFDSAEGILRAIRLLSKLNIDGQELMLNFNSATKEYLERYVEKKRENMKKSEAVGTEGAKEAEKEEVSATSSEQGSPSKSTLEEDKDADRKDEDITKFGLVTDEDKEADRAALEKLNSMIEERLKTHPLPPPPPPPLVANDGSGTLSTEDKAGLREGDSDVDMVKNDAAEDKTTDDIASNKTPNEHDKPDTSSPDRSRKNDRSRDRERDAKREKERELERNERDREQERAKKEREREYKTREDERRYRVCVKDWEHREREKDQKRKLERERDEERAEERKYEILDQEHESDDGYNKKRKYRSSGEERKRRQREKEDDLADRLKEEEEIAEAKIKAEEKQKQEQEDNMRLLSASATKESKEAIPLDEAPAESTDEVVDMFSNGDSEHENHMTDRIIQNGGGDEIFTNSIAVADTRQSSNAQSKKLGFGLVASGKRTAVPSVFSKEEDEDAQKDKKMRPLVPIDYSNEELQAVQHGSGAPASNLAAAAEFAKHITGVKSKEEKPEAEKDRSRHSHEKSRHRDQEWNDHESHRSRDDSRKETVDREKDREHRSDKVKTPDNRKLFDAKQLIDTIPKTKDELFSYEINWAVYDKNQLHERMRPWISKKITEFLGEEETSLVNYIVSTTQEHVNASEVLDRLQSILDDEAEMFVLKMWRMLIFEIKKVETGLAGKPKT